MWLTCWVLAEQGQWHHSRSWESTKFWETWFGAGTPGPWFFSLQSYRGWSSSASLSPMCWVWTSRWRNGAPGQEAPVCTSHRTGGSWQAESQGRNYLLKMDFNWMVLEWIDLRPVSSRLCQRNISLPGWQLREQRSSQSCLIEYGRGVAEWFGLAHWGWPLCGEYGPHLLLEDPNGRVRRCPGVCLLSKDGDWG